MTNNLSPKEARIERHLWNRIAKLSDANRPIVTRLVKRRSNAGIKLNSNSNFVFCLGHVDLALAGKALDTFTVPDVEDAIAELRSKLSETTAFIATRQLQRALTMLSPTGKLDQVMKNALQTRRPREGSNADRIIEDRIFHALLEAGANHRCGRGTHTPDLSVAVQWTLWDGGPRAHEALAVRLSNVKLEDDGTVSLVIPDDAALLKTGGRTIVMAEGVAALKAWMAVHPAAGNPQAPLFCGFYDKTGLVPLGYESLVDHLASLSRKVGLDYTVTPHDFRHTCATRKARAGWVESELRLFFGWKPKSNMPSRYVNTELQNLRHRVRSDLGMTPTGFATTQPMSDEAMLAQLLRRIAQSRQGARTTVPGSVPVIDDP